MFGGCCCTKSPIADSTGEIGDDDESTTKDGKAKSSKVMTLGRRDQLDVDDVAIDAVVFAKHKQMLREALTVMSSDEIGDALRGSSAADLQKFVKAARAQSGFQEDNTAESVKQTLQDLVRSGSAVDVKELVRSASYSNVQDMPSRITSAIASVGGDWKAAAAAIKQTDSGASVEEVHPATFNINVDIGPDIWGNDAPFDSKQRRMKASIALKPVPPSEATTASSTAPKLIFTAITPNGERAAQVKTAWTNLMNCGNVPPALKSINVQVKMQFVVWTLTGPDWSTLPSQDFLNFARATSNELTGRMDIEFGCDADTVISQKDRSFASVVSSCKCHFEAVVGARVKLAVISHLFPGKDNGNSDAKRMAIMTNIMNGLSADIRVASMFEVFDTLGDPDVPDEKCATEGNGQAFSIKPSFSDKLTEAPKEYRQFVETAANAGAEVKSIVICNLPGDFEMVATLENFKFFKLLLSMLSR